MPCISHQGDHQAPHIGQDGIEARHLIHYTYPSDEALARVHSAKGDGFFRVFSPENEFLGIGEKNVETGCLAVKRVLQGE